MRKDRDDDVVFQVRLTADDELTMTRDRIADPEMMLAIVDGILGEVIPQLNSEQATELFNHVLLRVATMDQQYSIRAELRCKNYQTGHQQTIVIEPNEIEEITFHAPILQIEMRDHRVYGFVSTSDFRAYGLQMMNRAQARKELMANGATHQVYDYAENQSALSRLVEHAQDRSILHGDNYEDSYGNVWEADGADDLASNETEQHLNNVINFPMNRDPDWPI